MWRNKEYLPSVQKALNEIGGICKRCILRFGGVKSSREHNNILIEDDIIVDSANVPAMVRGQVTDC